MTQFAPTSMSLPPPSPDRLDKDRDRSLSPVAFASRLSLTAVAAVLGAALIAAASSMRERVWLAFGALSIGVLLVAVVVPERLAVALAATGFAGLLLFRMTARLVGWAPQSAARADDDTGGRAAS